MVFLYINNEHSEKGIKKISFTVASNTKLRNKLNQGDKTCMMKITKHCCKKFLKGKTSYVHGTEDLTLLRCQHYSMRSTDTR